MNIILIVLVSILIVLVLVLMVLFLVKKNKESSSNIDTKDIELLKENINSTTEKNTLNIKSYLDELILKNKESLSEVEKQVIEKFNESKSKIADVENQLSKRLDDKLLGTNNKVDKEATELRNMLISLNEISSSIPDVKNKVDNLSILLSQNNKAGKAGEYLLERMLENISGLSSSKNILFEKQYKMKKTDNGKELRVDLFIKGNGGKFVNIPVDSKFPFNDYLKLCEYKEGTDSYKKAYQDFRTSVKDRMKEAAKYISSEDNTVYSIMFVPSESIFSFINDNTDLIDKAINDHVIIAGPSTLLSIIYSVDQYMNLFENINSYDKKVEILKSIVKAFDNLGDVVEDVRKAQEKALNLLSDISKKHMSLKLKLDKLEKISD